MADDSSSGSQYVVTASRGTFDRDVFERSHEVPVVVDFWAAWCGPCRVLGPLLEKLADEYAGKFILVKANTEELPDAAAAFGVQSIPAVFALVRGNIASSFAGLVPESQLREWLDQVLVQQLLEEAKEAENGELQKSEALYRSALGQLPNSATATMGLARVLLALDRVQEAEKLVVELEKRGFLEPEAEKLKATLAMRSKQGLDVGKARSASEAEPGNLQRQLELAEALGGAGQYQDALDICLTLIEQDRSNTGESARQMMLEIFRVLPDDSELTRDYRRRLSMLLF
jgi:putative thioredoxin